MADKPIPEMVERGINAMLATIEPDGWVDDPRDPNAVFDPMDPETFYDMPRFDGKLNLHALVVALMRMMREPTKELLTAAGAAIFSQNNEDWTEVPDSAKAVVIQMANTHWQAMIDAALGE